MKTINIFLILLSLAITNTYMLASTDGSKPEVGIEERTGELIPLNLKFTNSDGKLLSLKEIFDRPIVLSMVYYHCPGICTPLLNSLSETVDQITMDPGKDFKLITISFDHNETYETAAKWKDSYFEGIKRKDISPDDWYFMVGDSISIRRLTEALGFYFKSDGANDFIHAGSIYALAENGKIARYLFGTEFLPADLKMAIIEAKNQTSSPTINKILSMCYSYDPVGHTFKLSVTRIAGAVMVLGTAIFLAVLFIKKKKTKPGDHDEVV